MECSMGLGFFLAGAGIAAAITPVPDLIDAWGIETYATVNFVGQITNPDARGPIVELDDNTWKEANTWTFEELS
jgi:hypothetical protein